MSDTEYRIFDVTPENVDDYDLFCLKSRKKKTGYQNKLTWFRERYEEGLRIKLLHIKHEKRGFLSRGFIEYIPGEYAWRGINAKGYMVIHCIWVPGKNKQMGYGSELLVACESDAARNGMQGVAVVTATKTHGIPKPDIFIKHGFEKVDESPPLFELYAKRFPLSDDTPLEAQVPIPSFPPVTEKEIEQYGAGLTVFYSDQCPYGPDMIPVVERVAKNADMPVTIERITDCAPHQKSGINPHGVFCALLDGEILTQRFITEKGLIGLLAKKGIELK